MKWWYTIDIFVGTFDFVCVQYLVIYCFTVVIVIVFGSTLKIHCILAIRIIDVGQLLCPSLSCWSSVCLSLTMVTVTNQCAV